MKSKINLLVLASLILFTACERVAKVDIPQTNPLPVLFSFLSPESENSLVTISMSAPIYGSSNSGQFKQITNAQVTISDNNGSSKMMPFDIIKSAYKLDQTEFPINPGMTYTIEAKFLNYNVKGVTIVPNTLVYFDEIIGEKLPQDPTGGDRYLIRMKWLDEIGVTNYYRVNLEELYGFNSGDTAYYSIGDKMLNDQGKDGLVVSDKLETYNFNFGGIKPIYTAYLLNTDIHYYEYHRRRLVYFGDDPFSEPVQQYSNVKGGLGVVASYRKTKTSVVIK